MTDKDNFPFSISNPEGNNLTEPEAVLNEPTNLARGQNFIIFEVFNFYHPLSPVEDKVVQRQALFRGYGCFFAEFLGEYSLVRLGLLDLTTCVGLRYGFSRVEA